MDGVEQAREQRLGDLLAHRGGQVGHLPRVGDEPAVVLVGQLFAAEFGQAELRDGVAAAGFVEVGEVVRRHRASRRVEDQGQGCRHGLLSVSHPRLAEIDWRTAALVATMGAMANPTMPMRAAAPLTFFYALGYPVGALAVSVMSPMAVLVFRFGLAAAILAVWARLAKVSWPTGRTLTHVLISGLLAQGVLFTCLYVALMHGAPAVLGAVIISMNPVVTALLAAMFLGEGLTWMRAGALVLGVLAVLASCAGRLLAVGGLDPAVLLILVSLVSVAAGGVYQQKFCTGVDFRATAALQNAACILPVVASGGCDAVHGH